MTRQIARYGFTLIELLIVIAIIAILALIAIPNFLEAQTRSKVSRVMADQRSIATAIEAYFVDYNAYPIYGHPADDIALEYSFAGSGASTNAGERTFLPVRLTTPVAYITRLMPTGFPAHNLNEADRIHLPLTYFYRYFAEPSTFGGNTPAQWTDYVVFGKTYASGSYGKQATRVNKAHDCYHHTGWFQNAGGEGRSAQWMVVGDGPTLQCHTIQRSNDPQYRTAWGNANYPDLRYDPTNGTISAGDISRFSGK